MINLPSRVEFSDNICRIRGKFNTTRYFITVKFTVNHEYTRQWTNTEIDKAQVAGVTNDVIFDRNYIRGWV